VQQELVEIHINRYLSRIWAPLVAIVATDLRSVPAASDNIVFKSANHYSISFVFCLHQLTLVKYSLHLPVASLCTFRPPFSSCQRPDYEYKQPSIITEPCPSATLFTTNPICDHLERTWDGALGERLLNGPATVRPRWLCVSPYLPPYASM
jgi:hypothetical protein